MPATHHPPPGLPRQPVTAVFRCLFVLLLSVFLAAPPVLAAAEGENGIDLGFEVRGHWRDSDFLSFPSPFRFPADLLPPGETTGFLETPEAGSHGEISVVTLWLTGQWGERFAGKLKLDLIDRHDRNPTSDGDEIDLDEAWIRWGEEVPPATLAPGGVGMYAKLGKFPKFERQNDRHLESYGLIGTAFNRFEDVGLEVGFDLGRHLYAKASLTQGNPLFFRDPNALAGDNGITEGDGSPDITPELGTGFPIFYDADIGVDDVDFENPEVGVGVGMRLESPGGALGADILVWAYERELAQEVDLGGTLYGGDLDLLRGPLNLFPLPLTNGDKEEVGANLWIYWRGLAVFAQYADQDLAGLPRDGYEIEASWTFELPYLGALWGRQVLSFLTPTVRYSKLDPDIPPPVDGDDPSGMFPAPSVRWDWEKIDLGFRLGLVDRLFDLTVEWNLNDMTLASGRVIEADEFLATVRWQMDWDR